MRKKLTGSPEELARAIRRSKVETRLEEARANLETARQIVSWYEEIGESGSLVTRHIVKKLSMRVSELDAELFDCPELNG